MTKIKRLCQDWSNLPCLRHHLIDTSQMYLSIVVATYPPTKSFQSKAKKCQKMSFFHLSLSHTQEIMGQFQAIYVSLCHHPLSLSLSLSFSHTHKNQSLYVWMCVYVCVCVCVWEREREGDCLSCSFSLTVILEKRGHLRPLKSKAELRRGSNKVYKSTLEV